ncbi:hypothetical protein ACFWDI_06910 [Streptomyces sp. NPDC060064]
MGDKTNRSTPTQLPGFSRLLVTGPSSSSGLAVG